MRLLSKGLVDKRLGLTVNRWWRGLNNAVEESNQLLRFLRVHALTPKVINIVPN